MKTDKSTVFDLFQTHRRYVVPLFQRGYVWTRDLQWQPLWEDIVAQAADLARSRAAPTGHATKHFLGALVLNLAHHALKEVPIVEIIDGQQRLTTLQVLLAALRDETASIDNPFLKADLVRLTGNKEPLVSPDERFKVWPTSALQKDMKAVMGLGSLAAIEEAYKVHHVFKYGKWRPPRPGIVEAYSFFVHSIRRFLDDDRSELPLDLVALPAAERAEVLVEALIRDIQLVTIALEAEDDAQVIFETLNARGEPLTPADLVRNFLFLTATRQGLDVARLYEDSWPFGADQASTLFWSFEERQGRLKRSRLDQFFFHYVTFRTGRELKIGHLYQAFRDWWESASERSVEHELQEISEYSDIYCALVIPDPQTGFGKFARSLRALDTTTVYPLVLWLAGQTGLESAVLSGMLEDLESYLIRRAVCGYDQKAYNRFFLEVLDRMRAKGEPPAPQHLRQILAASQAETVVWPSDEEFRRHLIRDPIYRTLGPRRTMLLLEALDEASRASYAEDIQITSPLTVEHVLPQGATEPYWPLAVGSGETPDAAWARRLETSHRLGNLTLLTQPLNSAVSNGPYEAKRKEIVKQSLLPMNVYFQSVDHWDEAAIETRGAALAETALRVWPRHT
jgi:hypothetical protein